MISFKNITVILLILIYIFSATATKEFLKLPLLVEHFYDHKSENFDKGLISFLFQHYYVEDGSDADAEEDNRLPFKSIPEQTFNTIFSVKPPVTAGLKVPFVLDENLPYPLYNDLSIPSGFEDAIWHPPCF